MVFTKLSELVENGNTSPVTLLVFRVFLLSLFLYESSLFLQNIETNRAQCSQTEHISVSHFSSFQFTFQFTCSGNFITESYLSYKCFFVVEKCGVTVWPHIKEYKRSCLLLASSSKKRTTLNFYIYLTWCIALEVVVDIEHKTLPLSCHIDWYIHNMVHTSLGSPFFLSSSDTSW